jgi:hypothetical protein
MALIDLKSNLSNFRSDFPRESTKTSTVDPIPTTVIPKISPVNPTGIPVKDKISPKDVPGQVNFFNDEKGGAKGFINKSNNRFNSNIIGIDSGVYNYVNPIGIPIKDKISLINPIVIPVKEKQSPKTIPGQVNFLSNTNATGFTLKANNRFKSDFIGVNDGTFNSNLQNIKATPAKTSPKDVPGQVNFFNDIRGGAKGFSLKASDKFKSDFIGLEGGLYNYGLAGTKTTIASNFITPSISIQHNDALPRFNASILEIGTYKMDNQLGENGSPFKYLKDGAISTKKFSTRGYHAKNRYNDVVKSVSNQSNKSLLFVRGTERNSPSAIDAEYARYDLREESYNPTYMKQPFIIRSIGKRWGFRTSPGAFDDGLIRGGMVTALDRSVQDTVRIAKWMASPKGLLWVVKQIGLGLTNSKVEALGPGLLTRQTRIHTGLASLLSVPGAAFGLHFTRHGLPFANEIASYESVVNKRNDANTFDRYSLLTGNRLVKLREDLLPRVKPGAVDKPSLSKFAALVKKAVATLKSLAGFKGETIEILSGLAGPNSVYGIGATTIRRHVDTLQDAKNRAAEHNFNIPWTYEKQYATTLSTSYKKSSGTKYTGDDNTIEDVNDFKHSLKSRLEEFKTENTPSPGSKKEGLSKLHTAQSREKTGYPGAQTDTINDYITLAYSRIQKQPTRPTVPIDFRDEIAKKTNLSPIQKGIVGVNSEVRDYYKDYNIEKRYGMGNLGEVARDKSKPYTFLIKGTQFGTANRAILSGDPRFKGDKINALDVKKNGGGGDPYPANHKDFIKFYFEDGTQGNNIIVFRATMTGFSDSFTPGWDRIDIMGRPDGAYLYNSFERTISFNFMVAATTRSEMIPMWRKLNYLASYTMPDFIGGSRPSGPMMRFTIGDLFSRTPGFITSLNYTIPDDATWDIAEDKESTAPSKDDAKQLPMVVEVALSATIVGDFRPQLMG